MTPAHRQRVRILLADAFFGAVAAAEVGLAMRQDARAFERACAVGYVRPWQRALCVEVRER